MSKNIVIANRKGGVGKSTLATNLAVEYSRKVGNTILVDVDISKTSLKFMERRADLELAKDTLKIALPTTIDELDKILESDTIAEYKIVDVGGYNDTLAITAIFGSDLLVVPISDSPQDKDTTLQFIETIKQAQKDGFLKDCIFVLNNVSPNAKFENLAKKVEYVREAGFDLYGAIGSYKIFEHGHGGGQSVCEINEDCNASSAILKLISGIQGRYNG